MATTKNIGNTYKNDTVELDGQWFENCVFDHCVLVYRGGEPPSLVGNTIMHCTYQFQDAALRSLAWLHGLWVMGEKDVVNGFIREIKTDAPPSGSQKLH